jgi:hypothetical protein
MLMKPIYDILTAITNHHLDVRTLLEWGGKSLDFHDMSVWGAKSARWYACQVRAGLARAKAALFPPGPAPAELPIVTVDVRGGLIEDVDATIPIHVVTLDWDVPDEDTGKKPTRSIWTLAGGLSGPKAAKLRRLIAND